MKYTNDKKTFRVNIENKTLNNKLYRKILYTNKNQQLVIMSIPIGDEIKREKHLKSTQFIRIEKGNGIVEISNSNNVIIKRYRIYDGISIIIPNNTYHRIRNIGNTELKLYSIYSPPAH